jgi:hypothetical protein
MFMEDYGVSLSYLVHPSRFVPYFRLVRHRNRRRHRRHHPSLFLDLPLLLHPLELYEYEGRWGFCLHALLA